MTTPRDLRCPDCKRKVAEQHEHKVEIRCGCGSDVQVEFIPLVVVSRQRIHLDTVRIKS